MSKTLGIGFENALRFLSLHMPISDENCRKSILFHDIRVGIYLYENGYSEDIIIAGLLHDIIEWSNVNEGLLREAFGEDITRLVLASTKDDTILNKEERRNELISRCIQNGQDALIIKTADTLDSFKWYETQNNLEELYNHCMKTADLILKLKPDYFDDKIFDELKKWVDKCQ